MGQEKVALVLGAVKGIGKAIGLALAQRGIRTALTWYDWEDSLDSMIHDFSQTGTDHEIIKINLLETETIQSMVEQVIRRFGRLDILVNNIERGGMPIVHGSYTRNQWDLEMGTSLRAKQWVFEAAYPYLKQSPDGLVINFSSISGMVGRSGPVSYLFNEGYSALNRGISLLTETWARLGAPQIRVNEIMLGIMDTRHGHGTRGWGLLPESVRHEIIEHTLLGRTGNSDDVVKTCLFLIEDAPFMTGSVIRLDGGYVLGGDRIYPMPPGVE
ncbi:MAG: SDR family oxidoreductase [Proteobacteria bacterium]|nr:SDR family oxidoreductase [Pseudomonadota bacterium]